MIRNQKRDTDGRWTRFLCTICEDEGSLGCSACAGSGEGMHPRSRCRTCGGSGEVRCECVERDCYDDHMA